MYDNLILPWQIDNHDGNQSGHAASLAFPESDFVRHEWDRDGVLSNGQDFFLADGAPNGDESGATTLDDLEDRLGTASMVTRWREAHPDLAGTERDCVKEMGAEIRRAMGDENPKFKTGSAVVLLLFKRR